MLTNKKPLTFTPGLYRHRKGSRVQALAIATQGSEENVISLTPLNVIAFNSEHPYMSAELYLSDFRGQVIFVPLHSDWQMDGEWIVYQELTDKRYWLRPKEMFLDGRFVPMNHD